MSKTAKYIKTLEGWAGVARLYETSDQGYVIVSAIGGAFDTARPETYIFPADSDGRVTDWGELDGSYQGGTDHGAALRGAGYTVT